MDSRTKLRAAVESLGSTYPEILAALEPYWDLAVENQKSIDYMVCGQCVVAIALTDKVGEPVESGYTGAWLVNDQDSYSAVRVGFNLRVADIIGDFDARIPFATIRENRCNVRHD